jgi:hypothetical protein
MTNLRCLHLTNCPKVSDETIVNLLSHSVPGIADLALEGTSAIFDLTRFAITACSTTLLVNLRSITLTAPAYSGPRAEYLVQEWFSALLVTLASSPIERLHVYASWDKSSHAVPDTFVRSVAGTHKARLQRFSVHRMGLSLSAIEYLCQTCPKLEELFVTIADNQLVCILPHSLFSKA